MRSASIALGLAATISTYGCGGATPPAESGEKNPAETTSAEPPTPTTSAEPSAAPPNESGALSLDCTKRGDLCVPSAKLVTKLCNAVNPDVALAFFRRGTPFTRGYLRGDTQAWNASGGVSSMDKLVFDEEVIVLRTRENKTGIEVSGASGGFDVLRWDGSCATLSSEELTLSVAPKPKSAKVEWRYLADATQSALLGSEAISKANKERRDECKGASMGEVSKKCVKAVDKLSDAIVAFVRDGGEIPLPATPK